MKLIKLTLALACILSATTSQCYQSNFYANIVRAYVNKSVDPITGHLAYKECIRSLSYYEKIDLLTFVQTKIIELNDLLEQAKEEYTRSLESCIYLALGTIGLGGTCAAMFTWQPNLSTKERPKFTQESYSYNPWNNLKIKTSTIRVSKTSDLQEYRETAACFCAGAIALGIAAITHGSKAFKEKNTRDALKEKIDQLRALKDIIELETYAY